MLLTILFDRRIRIYILFIIFNIRFSCENNEIFNKIIKLEFNKLNKLFFKTFVSKISAKIFLLFLAIFCK